MPAQAVAQGTKDFFSLSDLNFFLVNKLVVLIVVLLFFVTVLILRRMKEQPVSPLPPTGIKLALIGLALLYLQTLLTPFPSYQALLDSLQSVIVLICLAKLAIYIAVDVVLSLRRHGDVPMLLRDAIRLAVYVIAAIASLSLVFKVDLSSVITTTTVLTAAIAFAMQNTVANAFYGFNVQIDRQLSKGNWISLPEKNLFGQIMNVGFRYTTMRTLDNNQLLVPNSMIVQSIVTTHGSAQMPPPERAALTLSMGLPYELSPEQARSILMGVLQNEQMVLDDPAPAVRVQTLADSSIHYVLRFWIADPAQKNVALDIIQTNAWYALNRAGWSFPYPHRQILTTPTREPFIFSADLVLEELAHVDLFAGLERSLLKQLATDVQVKVSGPGEVLVSQGDEGSSLFLVLSGELSVEIDGNIVGSLEQHSFFGEMSLLSGEPRKATVRAVGEVWLAEVTHVLIERIVRTDPSIMDALGDALILREQQMHAAARNAGAQASTALRKDVYLERLKNFFGL